jgi:hypothetical protein
VVNLIEPGPIAGARRTKIATEIATRLRNTGRYSLVRPIGITAQKAR